MEHCPIKHCLLKLETKKYEVEIEKKGKFRGSEEAEDNIERVEKKPEINLVNIVKVEAPEIMSSLKATGLSDEARNRIIKCINNL